MPNNNYVTLGSFKSKNNAMKDIINNLDTVAESEYNVLIVGEHGSGRDSAAKMIHSMSSMSSEPMDIIECNGIKMRDIVLKPGRITYIDEVNLLGKKLQNKLMKEMVKVQDARVIASADKTLGIKMDENKFYEDLYYMLAQIRIGLPTLRERSEDIECIVRAALSKYNKKYLKNVKIKRNVMSLLKRYKFPGNVSELYNIVERAVLVNQSGTIMTSNIISILDMDSVSYVSFIKDSPMDFKEELRRFSVQTISSAIENSGSIKGAARLLNMKPNTLSKKCKDLNINMQELIKLK